MSAWNETLFSVYRMLRYLSVLLARTVGRMSGARSQICLVIISKLLYGIYFDFICAFLSLFCSRLATAVRRFFCCCLSFCFAIHLWIRDCRSGCCIENLKTISVLLLQAIQTVKSLDRTEWMYSDLEIDGVFAFFFLSNFELQETENKTHTYTHNANIFECHGANACKRKMLINRSICTKKNTTNKRKKLPIFFRFIHLALFWATLIRLEDCAVVIDTRDPSRIHFLVLAMRWEWPVILN